MTVPTVGDRSADEHISSMADRLAVLRGQTTELTKRAQHASNDARELRAGPHPGCSHAEQVRAMQSALDAVEHELDGLRTAMLTRGTIEQAKGMLMLHRQCAADEAFQLLVELSQTSHRKLSEVALTLVETWSGDGAPT